MFKWALLKEGYFKMKDLILFGAGKNGVKALKKYGAEHIACFCDNAKEKQGTSISGVKVVSFDEMISLHYEGYVIMVTPANNIFMIGQLEQEGIYDYLIFHPDLTWFPLKNAEEEEKRYAAKNGVLDDFVARSKEWNLLEDISGFARLSAEILEMSRRTKQMLSYSGFMGEGGHYGNLNALVNYAGIFKEDVKYFPIVSHQDCQPLYTPAFDYKSAVVMSGEYYKRKIHERAPYVPVFTVGPYIHYAKGIYGADRLEKEKKKTGTMLLAFLPHTIENIQRKYSRMQFIDSVLQEYGGQFQSIWCCVYWTDVNDPVCEYAKNKGIHVVTAGLRFDMEFDRRLKTILELSDAIVCGDIGTFISYALFMGKPVGRLDISDNRTIAEEEWHSNLERSVQFTEDYKNFSKDFYLLFNHELKNERKQRKWMNGVAGFDKVRSAGYLRDVSKISKDIWNQCGGDMRKYPESVKEVYVAYEKNFEFGKMAILKDAVGAYLN